MAKKKEITVEDKLRSLYDLQLIDSRIDEIRNLRGELPLEVSDLSDEIAGLEKRIQKNEDELEQFESGIKEQKLHIENSHTLIKKYEEIALILLSTGLPKPSPKENFFNPDSASLPPRCTKLRPTV